MGHLKVACTFRNEKKTSIYLCPVTNKKYLDNDIGLFINDVNQIVGRQICKAKFLHKCVIFVIWVMMLMLG